MIALVTENAPPRLRGRMSLILLEVRAGVYLGTATHKVRDSIWDIVINHIETGSAVMCWPDLSNATGVCFKTCGDNRRRPVEVDGLLLVQFDREVLSTDVALKSVELPVEIVQSKNSNLINELRLEVPPRQRG